MKKLILVIAALALIASPAMAVDWNFYGSARMATFYNSRDFNNGTASDLDGGGGELRDNFDEDDQLTWDMQTNSRLGATVKAENISGRFEFSADDGANNVGLRRLFGVWDFGAAKLKVGKDYTPYKQFISGQVFGSDAGLLGFGTAYGGRHGQISLSFGGFEVALITNEVGLLRAMDTGDVDIYLPKVEAAWGMAFDTWNFKLIGGFQWYEIEDGGAGEDDVDVTSWILGADAGVNFGPIYIKGGVSTGTNWGNAGWSGATAGAAFDGDDETDDIDTVMAALVGGWKFTDQLTFEIGGGYNLNDPDEDGQDDTNITALYAQAVISLAPGVTVIPEAGYYSYGTDFDGTGQNDGTQFYVGGKWQIDF
ncbi:MAG: hypothetical protein KAS40_10520 [Desulfobacterales bacterium]|nr:hypothetical protein [Desulfobacterales bacterium]